MTINITGSLSDYIKNKIDSSFYGTLFIFWSIVHWKFLVTLFFVSEEQIEKVKYGVIKTDYLSQLLFDFHHLWISISLSILPLILTYLAIWVLPRFVTIPAFEKEYADETKKEIIKIKKQQEIETERVKFEKQNIETLGIIAKKTEKEKEVKELDPTIGWKEEYENFKTNYLFRNFDFIIKSIYEYNGDIVVYDKTSYISPVNIFQIPKNILAYAHSNNIINLDKINGKIELTEKGKFFVKEYSLNKDEI